MGIESAEPSLFAWAEIPAYVIGGWGTGGMRDIIGQYSYTLDLLQFIGETDNPDTLTPSGKASSWDLAVFIRFDSWWSSFSTQSAGLVLLSLRFYLPFPFCLSFFRGWLSYACRSYAAPVRARFSNPVSSFCQIAPEQAWHFTQFRSRRDEQCSAIDSTRPLLFLFVSSFASAKA